MTRFDVTALGEIMLRFSVPAGDRLEVAARMDVAPGGAEGNVMVALSRLGRRCGYVTALPDHATGRLIATALRGAGVDVSALLWRQNGRVGTYFIEFSAPPRPIQVIYDRADSCAAHLTATDPDWDYLLDTRLLHITGITPAISPSCREMTAEAVRRARVAGVPLSFDINYRSKLWSVSEAEAALRPLIEGADILFCKRSDAALLFGCGGDAPDALRTLAAQTGAKQVIMTQGDQGVLGWSASEGIVHHAPALPVVILDRIGAGDALAAGVLDGWLDGTLEQGLRRGTALAALCLSQRGDLLITTRAEVEALLAAGGAGGVQR
jgi:2-dehydro-3-deoxygluconokinase